MRRSTVWGGALPPTTPAAHPAQSPSPHRQYTDPDSTPIGESVYVAPKPCLHEALINAEAL